MSSVAVVICHSQRRYPSRENVSPGWGLTGFPGTSSGSGLARTAFAFAIPELVVEMTFLDGGGPLVVERRLGALALGLGLRNPRLMLGLVSPAACQLRLLASLRGDLPTPLTKLKFGAPRPQ
jgi:hypothetical protein